MACIHAQLFDAAGFWRLEKAQFKLIVEAMIDSLAMEHQIPERLTRTIPGFDLP